MLKSLPILIFIATYVNLENPLATNDGTNIDSTFIVSKQGEPVLEEEVDELSFESIQNEYVIEDLSDFSPEDLVTSDIIVYDENGTVYMGTILIQDNEGVGIISDEAFQEQEILVAFLPGGQLVVCSEHPSMMKVEVLNYKIADNIADDEQ